MGDRWVGNSSWDFWGFFMEFVSFFKRCSWDFHEMFIRFSKGFHRVFTAVDFFSGLLLDRRRFFVVDGHLVAFGWFLLSWKGSSPAILKEEPPRHGHSSTSCPKLRKDPLTHPPNHPGPDPAWARKV